MSEKALEILISANVPAIKEIEHLIKSFRELAKAMGEVQQLAQKKGGVVVGQETIKGVKKQAEETVKSTGNAIKTQWSSLNTLQRQNIRTWGAVSVDEIKRVQKEQEKALLSFGKAKTDAGLFEWITGKTTGKSAKESAKIFERHYKELEKMLKVNEQMTRSGGFEWLTGAQARKNAEESARIFERAFDAQDKLTQSANKLMTQGGAFDWLTGSKSGKSAKESAKAFEELLHSIEKGGIIRKELGVLATEADSYVSRQMRSWAGKGVAGAVAFTDQDLARFEKFAELNNVMSKKTGWLKDYARDVSHMMSMQARWFTGAGLIFGAIMATDAAAKAMMDFYQSLKNIQAITGTSDVGIRSISDAAIEVAKTTPVAANEAAKFGLKLIQAGLSAEETAKAMQTVAALVTVTGENAEGISKAVTTTMFAWKLEAKDIPQIGQTIAAALNFSRLSVEDLGTAFNYLASTASIMGRSLQETTAVMGVLSNMGIRASTIGTGVTQLWTELLVPSEKFAEELRRIGVSANDVNPTMNKMADIVDRLREKGFSAAKAYDLLGDRAGRELAAALVAGGKAFRDMEADIARSTQLTNGLQKAMEGPINALKRMRNEFEIAAIQAGSVAVPAIQALTQMVTYLAKVVQLATSGVSTLVELIGPTTLKYATIGASAITLAIAALATFKKKVDVSVKGVGSLVSLLFNFMKMHPYIKAITVALGGLALIGAAFGKTKKQTEGIREAYEATEKEKKRQREESQRLEEQAKREERAATALKEAWEKTATTDPRMPLLDKLLTMQIELEATIGKIKNLKEEIVSIPQIGDKHWKGPKDFLNDPNIKKFMDDLNKGLEGVGGEEGVMAYAKDKQYLQIEKQAKEIYKTLNAEKIASQAINEALVDRSRTGAERISILKAGLIRELKAQQEILDTLWKKYGAETDKAKKEGILDEIISAEQNLELKKLKALPSIVELSSIRKGWEDDAERAKNELKNTINEFERFVEETKGLEKYDPYGDIFRNARQEADRLKKEIYDVDSQIKKVGAEMKSATEPKDRALLEGYLKSLQDRKDVLTDWLNDKVGKRTDVQLNLKDEEVMLKYIELQIQANSELLDIEKERAGFVKELGLSTQIAAIQKEVELERQKLDAELSLLQTQWQIAESRGEGEKTAEISAKIRVAEAKKELLVHKEQAEIAKATLDIYEKAFEQYSNYLDAIEAKGGDVSREKEYADYLQKIADLGQAGAITQAEYFELAEKKQKALYWGTLELTDAYEGFGLAIQEGVIAGLREMGNAYDWAVRIGKDAVSTLQTSTSDFFFNLSTAEGFDPEEHENFWRYFQDVVDDFLKSIHQGFMRTLGDIYSEWLTRGILEWVSELTGKKLTMEAADRQAIGTQALLTTTLQAQTGTVMSLTDAYWALAAAKMAAGMGGLPGMDQTVGTSAMTSQVDTSTAMSGYWMTRHSGGLIFHKGGFVPKYHKGGLSPDERLAILQTGEYVVSRRGVKALDAINQGDVGGEADMAGSGRPIIIIKANDAKSFADMVRRNPGPIVQTFNRDMSRAGSSRSTIRRFAF